MGTHQAGTVSVGQLGRTGEAEAMEEGIVYWFVFVFLWVEPGSYPLNALVNCMLDWLLCTQKCYLCVLRVFFIRIVSKNHVIAMKIQICPLFSVQSFIMLHNVWYVSYQLMWRTLQGSEKGNYPQQRPKVTPSQGNLSQKKLTYEVLREMISPHIQRT